MADKKSVGVDLIGGLINNPEIQQQIVTGLLGLLVGVFTKLFSKKPAAPVLPVTVPTPNGGDENFPDDIIPPPATKKKIVKVVGKIARVQLNRQRFPDAPNGGLYDDVALKSAQAGGNIPYGSKVWLDGTAYDDEGKEFLGDRVLSHGLAYKTEHHAGDTFIKGHGADSQGQPAAGYETNDTDEIGNGISAWRSSRGFLHQIKCHGEGQFDCYVVIDGVESNHFPLNIS